MHNDKENINGMIENIRDNICDYDLKNMFINIDLLIVEMSNCIYLREMSQDRVNIFNNILENINISIQNKDYQLVSDILKFQLMNFIENI